MVRDDARAVPAILVAAMVLAGSPAGAGGRQDAPPDVANRPIVLSLPPGAAPVKVTRDVRYRGEDAPEAKMDTYAPAGLGTAERRPVVVFIHGGPVPRRWSPKDWAVFRSYGELAATRGFIGITFNHRLHSFADYPVAAADLSSLLERLHTDAAALHADPGRIALWAFSGGGPLLATAFDVTKRPVSAVVSYYAVLDPLEAEGGDLGDSFSPVRLLDRGRGPFPPVFVARAGRDAPAINASVDRFISSAFTKGVALEVFNVPAGRHGFDVLDDDERSREAIRRTLTFLDEQLGRAR